MRSWLSLAVLLVTVAGLAAWVYFRSAAPQSEAHALSELKPPDVTRIRLERSPFAEGETDKQPPGAAPDSAAASAIELERRSDVWYVTAPIAARADSFQVDRLLAILDARSLARYPAADPARYGLDKPIAKLTLNSETFSYGAINTTTREHYVLARDGVYAVPLAQRSTLPRDVQTVLSRALFAPGETPVRFELESFTALLEDGRWIFTPVTEEPGPDERNGWVAAWRQASAIRAAPHDGRKPDGKIAVALQDGRTITFGILQRDAELVLLRTDENIQYHFLADTAKRLLSPPGAKT